MQKRCIWILSAHQAAFSVAFIQNIAKKLFRIVYGKTETKPYLKEHYTFFGNRLILYLPKS